MKKWLFTLLCFGTGVNANVPYPQSVGILGDSSSAGTLANFERSRVSNVLYHFKILASMSQLLWGFKKESLSRGDLSWAEGSLSRNAVFGISARLKLLNPNLLLTNLATPGFDSSKVLSVEVPQLQVWSRSYFSNEAPDFSTLFVGANDLCQDSLEKIPSAKKFEENISKILEAMLQFSRTRVLVLALPRLDLLESRVKDAKIMGRLGLGMVNTCGDIWKMVPLCKTLTGGLPLNQVARVHILYTQYNEALRKAVLKHRKRYGDRVRFVEKTSNLVLGPEDVSIDCFHPNYKFQRKAAEIAWSYSWWADKI